ncbi:endonuclease I [Kipferlia bialata]|uniref:Endonuclease I n=2 Tax=Kipferlia bialata TaxID=797122 RepID=A0A9K3CNX7_9EUKA|nr:endonuclease I [Kipferlia bialata]|eukprot:g1414.t1
MPRNPMRCDLHHLRPAYDHANSARSNYPFANIPDEEVYKWYNQREITTHQPEESDIDNWSRVKKSTSWEPHVQSRGTVARAVLYFYTMYPQYIKHMGKVGDVNTFIQWNEDYPVVAWDIERNDRVETHQGNRNPYVDHPELCERAYEDMI